MLVADSNSYLPLVADREPHPELLFRCYCQPRSQLVTRPRPALVHEQEVLLPLADYLRERPDVDYVLRYELADSVRQAA